MLGSSCLLYAENSTCSGVKSTTLFLHIGYGIHSLNDSARLTEAGSIEKKILIRHSTDGTTLPATSAPATRNAYMSAFQLGASPNIYTVDHDHGQPEFYTPNKTKIYMDSYYGSDPPAHTWVGYWSNKENQWILKRYYTDGTVTTEYEMPPIPG